MSATPAFNRGYRLRHDTVRQAFVVLAPERLILLDGPGVAVLELVDGKRTVSEIASVLASRYDAPGTTIEADVDALLRDLEREGAIRL